MAAAAAGLVLGAVRPGGAWTPGTHRQFPAAFKAACRTVLLVAGRADSPLHRLPKEVLHLIFERTAEAWFWELEYGFALAEPERMQGPTGTLADLEPQSVDDVVSRLKSMGGPMGRALLSPGLNLGGRAEPGPRGGV